jgi:hypothetical protein
MPPRKRKFDDVPTEPLFDMEATEDHSEKQKRVKSVASGRCPECKNLKLGVVRQGEHLLWREHTYTTWSGARITCRASLIATCVAPERIAGDLPMHVAVLCPHTRDERSRILPKDPT